MNKQEAIDQLKESLSKMIENIEDENDFNKGYRYATQHCFDIIKQLDELEKPVVPQFVADWIEEHKGDYSKWDEEARAEFVFRSINDLFRFGEGLSPWDFTIDANFSDWTTENAYKFITAILFDYIIEKEKLYTVEIPNPNAGGHVVLCKTGDGRVSITFANAGRWRGVKNVQLTEAEIKQDFEWAWQFAKEVENDTEV